MLSVIGKGICYFLTLIETAIILRCILGWFIDPYSRFYQLIGAVTEPFVAPIRALLTKFMGDTPMMDFSPMIAVLIISAIEQVFRVIFG